MGVRWLAHFEYLQQLDQRRRWCAHRTSNLRRLTDGSWHWRRPLNVLHLISMHLYFLEDRLEVFNIPVVDITDDTTTDEADTEPLLSTFLDSLESNIFRIEQGLSLLERWFQQRHLTEDASAWHSEWHWVADTGNIDLICHAVDAVILGYYRDIFGSAFMRGEFSDIAGKLPSIYPIGVFMPVDSYIVDTEQFVISIPTADQHRLRLWPNIAHEIAHLKVRVLFGSTGLSFKAAAAAGSEEDIKTPASWLPLRRDRLRRLVQPEAQEHEWTDRVRRGAIAFHDLDDLLMNIYLQLFRDFGEPSLLRNRATFHLEELLCDAVAIHVAGPAAMWSFLASGAAEHPDFAKCGRGAEQCFLDRMHPPTSLRIALMSRMLEHYNAWLPGDVLKKVASSHMDGLISDLQPQGRALVEALLSHEDRLFVLLRELADITAAVDAFGPVDVKICETTWAIESIVDERDDNWSPRHLLNAAWMKRVTQHQCLLAAEKLEGLDRRRLMALGSHPPVSIMPDFSQRLARWGDACLSEFVGEEDQKGI